MAIKTNNTFPQVRDLIYNLWAESNKGFNYTAALTKLQDIMSINIQRGNPTFNNVNDVIHYFCHNDPILINEIKSSKSTHEITMLRKQIAYVAKFYFQYRGVKLTNYEIGAKLGHLDHSTVSYYITNINRTLNKKPYRFLKKELDNIIYNKK